MRAFAERAARRLLGRVYLDDEEPEKEWCSVTSAGNVCHYCGLAGHQQDKCPQRVSEGFNP